MTPGCETQEMYIAQSTIMTHNLVTGTGFRTIICQSKCSSRALQFAECGIMLQGSLAPEMGHFINPTWAGI